MTASAPPPGAIDLHCHWFPEPFLEAIEGEGGSHDVLLRREGDGSRRLIFKGVPHPPMGPFADVQGRLAKMDQRGIGMQVLSLSAQVHVSWGDPGLGLALAQIVNDEYARLAQAYPGRFQGIAAVPLHDPRKALEEGERAVRVLGLRGVGLLTNVDGTYLDDQRFWPLYERAQELGVPLVVHPANPAGKEKMREYELANFVGFPLETTLCVARLIFAGVLERFPRLSWAFYHGGGQVPYLLGRWDHGYRERLRKKMTLAKLPSEFARMLYFDTVVHSPEALGFLIKTVGVDRVVVGTDYPYDMADSDPVGTVGSVQSLTADGRQRILRENAAALLSLAG